VIAVIADDLSGAAELAGVARACGLSAEVQTQFTADTDADVVCVDTDTRSRSAADAEKIVTDVAQQVAAVRPDWIYKKCDSVLRGHVRVELEATMAGFALQRALLIPANPSRGRIIRDGEYFVNGQPLHESEFARDPEYRRTTACITELLGGDLSGIATPDVESEADVALQAAKIDAEPLNAGGADFFRALLKTRAVFRSTSDCSDSLTLQAAHTTLIVCGSAASWSRRTARANATKVPVFDLTQEPHSIAAALRTNRIVLMGIGDEPATHGLAPAALTQTLAQTVTAVLHQATVTHLLLEGGATAVAVVRALGFTRLRADQCSAPGVGALCPIPAESPRLWIKPGSYDWPDEIWPTSHHFDRSRNTEQIEPSWRSENE
jgi:uncharacterized protein YgbK (DUF1537 family)